MENGGRKCIRDRILKRGLDWFFRINFLAQLVGTGQEKTGGKLNQTKLKNKG